jgi:aryl-alcohol dehydrogenase-like predicted oxidoreductase
VIDLQTTRFGKTGLTVSRLCFGTATFGKQTDEEAAFEILDKAADAGVNFIDTADGYPMGADFSLAGRTEEILGRWLKGKRKQFILATKGGLPLGPEPWNRGASRKHLLDAIDGSLLRLKTDYVDLYQLHFDDPATPMDETLRALDIIVRSGKARYIGASNILAYRLARALGRSDTLSTTSYVSVQPRYNLLFREIERELLPLAQEEDLAVIPFNPLAGGMLTGKYQEKETATEGRFSEEIGNNFGALYQQRYWHDRQFQTVAQLAEIAKKRGVPVATLSVAWVLANPTITAAILGASRPEQLEATLAAANYVMGPELKKQLDELTAEYRRGDADR